VQEGQLGRRAAPWTAAPTLWLALASSALACGSMGLDDPRTRAIFTAAVFGPMVALIPVELGLLRWLGGLRERFIQAYLACLSAKFVGVLFVSWGAGLKLVDGIVAAELTYSLGHFLVSLAVLGGFFGLGGQRLVLCAAAISTLIPWLYSLALWFFIGLAT
jgi:hypothetical protein